MQFKIVTFSVILCKCREQILGLSFVNIGIQLQVTNIIVKPLPLPDCLVCFIEKKCLSQTGLLFLLAKRAKISCKHVELDGEEEGKTEHYYRHQDNEGGDKTIHDTQRSSASLLTYKCINYHYLQFSLTYKDKLIITTVDE